MSKFPRALKWAAVYTAGAYVADVVVRPQFHARAARKHADSLGLPLINVGAGTPKSSLRARVLGPTLWGDENLDLAAPEGAACGPNRVCYGDAQKLPYADNSVGAVILSHVIEHTCDPAKVLAEVDRVLHPDGRAYIIAPALWAPHTYVYRDHNWLVLGSVHGKKRWIPLWPKKACKI